MQYLRPLLSYQLSLRPFFCLFEWPFYTGFTVCYNDNFFYISHNIRSIMYWTESLDTRMCVSCAKRLSNQPKYITLTFDILWKMNK